MVIGELLSKYRNILDIGRLGAKSRTSQAPVRAGIGWGAGTAGRLGGTVGRTAQRATVRHGVARRGERRESCAGLQGQGGVTRGLEYILEIDL